MITRELCKYFATFLRRSLNLGRSYSTSLANESTVSIPQKSHELRRPISQPTSFTHGHLMTSYEITPGIMRQEYRQRRKIFRDSLPDNSVTILPSNTRKYMSPDVPYPYHPNSDLYYLTGLMESEAVLVLEKGLESDGHCVEKLFLRGRDESQELWEGPTCGVEEDIRVHFGVDHVYDVANFSTEVEGALERAQVILYNPRLRSDINTQLMTVREEVRRTLPGKLSKRTPYIELQKQRILKSESEIKLMRASSAIIAHSLNQAMAHTRAKGKVGGIPERHIEGRIEYECKLRGADKMAFPCVVASGGNGTILHYMANDNLAKDGDMVMVDAGCQYHGYSSDVSRSWPISGKFTTGQRELYALVLDVQKRSVTMATANNTYKGKPMSMNVLHSFTAEALTQGLIDLKIIRNMSLDEAIEKTVYLKYYPHAAGHYLGIDVHDTHDVSKDSPLMPGMIVTVEPGLYVRSDDMNVPEMFRGIGIRIEDDIAVGEAAAENLSAAAVKEIDDIEHLVGSG